MRQATVELFGAMALYGPFITHGSNTPGEDITGAGAANGGVFPALLHAKTDSVHTAGCAWADQASQAVDDIIGCSGCKDEVSTTIIAGTWVAFSRDLSDNLADRAPSSRT